MCPSGDQSPDTNQVLQRFDTSSGHGKLSDRIVPLAELVEAEGHRVSQGIKAEGESWSGLETRPKIGTVLFCRNV